MGFEAWAYNEQEKKNKKELEDKEQEEFQKKQVEQEKTKEYIKTEIETEDKLHSLHELVDQWILSKEDVEKVVNWEDLDEDTIKEIFDKIDQMDDIKNVDKYIYYFLYYNLVYLYL